MNDQNEMVAYAVEVSLTTSVTQLVDQLHCDELEYLTREAILEHRRLLSSSEVTYAAWKAVQTPSIGRADSFQRERLAYIHSMILLKMQQNVVAAFLDCLGYIPDIDDGSTSLQ